jgi:hypothetical protein
MALLWSYDVFGPKLQRSAMFIETGLTEFPSSIGAA